jgi:hypothetical protein
MEEMRDQDIGAVGLVVSADLNKPLGDTDCSQSSSPSHLWREMLLMKSEIISVLRQ